MSPSAVERLIAARVNADTHRHLSRRIVRHVPAGEGI